MRPRSSLQSAPLRLALRAASALARSEADPVLNEIAEEMARLVGDRSVPSRPEQGELHHVLLVAAERIAELHLRVEALACLQRAEPSRAQAAQSLLEVLPWPPRLPLSEEQTLVTGRLDGSQVHERLRTAQALLRAAGEPTVRSVIETLELAPLVDCIAGLVSRAQALADGLRLPTTPTAWQEEAVELLARFRAYVIVATGKLSPTGEDLARRQRLLRPSDLVF
ncbi:MAG: hypothetical protein RMK29_18580 [Myxococcales bacterium]|nr:hypothetical protein [Myxococcota bacterium]MDW8283716.1 hypothetical protein [Myxococcales bacterium]